MPVLEDAFAFGPENSLLGVLSRPGEGGGAKIACVLPNAGLIYRIGPGRSSVRFARALAERGIPTLRFDLAGVGDSKHVGESVEPRRRILDSLRAALDRIERDTGIRRFIVVGICSGATNGFHAAVADERIVGVLMYDGFWYRSRWTRAAWVAKRLRALRPAELIASLRRNWRSLWTREAEAGTGLAYLDAANPPKHEFVAQTSRLVARGVKLCFVYGGGVLPYYAYAGQFRDVFGREPFFPAIRCEFLPQVDHMLSTTSAQQAMQAVVVDWALDVATAQGGRP